MGVQCVVYILRRRSYYYYLKQNSSLPRRRQTTLSFTDSIQFAEWKSKRYLMKTGIRLFSTSFCLVLTGWLHACPIPVYQYSLEHWDADPYRITVHSTDPPSAEAAEALALLQHAARAEGIVANLAVELQSSTPENAPDTPRVEVRFPLVSGIDRVVWSGELTLDNVRALLHSPLREQIGQAMVARTSAVWLLLESGDREADREAATLIHRELERLQKETLVPDQADWGGETVEIDSNVNFKFMRLRRDQAEEQMLIRMLMATEADLESDFAHLPILFPIYGRGIVLYALVGRGINAWTIDDAVRFITGPCSCQIKADNPGIDLLTDTDWVANIQPLTPATVGETVGTGAFLQRHDQAERED